MHGYKFRFREIELVKQWDPPIKCHGAISISEYKSPLNECLGEGSNGVSGDLFLLGDSHAAQFSFPIRAIAMEMNKNFFFINTENTKDFPYSYFDSQSVSEDRLFKHILRVADPGDIVIVAFHRGRLNESRDKHLPLAYEIKENDKYLHFINNMQRQIQILENSGIRVMLVKDTPLLSEAINIEKCAYWSIKNGNASNRCSVALDQDLHTRTRQAKAFDYLGALFPRTVVVADPFIILYGNQKFYNPINSDGTFRMFDQHHLTESESLKLLNMFRSKIP